jgi:stearoyl-CoA desaturase (delta-9 desaturase)
LKRKDIHWAGLITVVGYHLLLFVCIPLYLIHYGLPSAGIIWATGILFLVTGVAITAGYHRYFAHKSYEAHPVVEFFLLFFGTMNLQNSVLNWAVDHRLHHAHTDSDQDPYDITKGFWYAHILWIFLKGPERDYRIVSDLSQKKLVAFQHKYYVLLFALTNLAVCGAIGYFFHDIAGALLFVWWFRIFAVNHLTWFINSLAHTWGEHTYSREESAVDNYMMAFLTFGEGYHNYHHAFAADYRNGIRWWHFDPSKWLIWSLSKVGLAKNLKRMDAYAIRRKLVVEDKELLLSKIARVAYVKKEEMIQRVEDTAGALSQRLMDLRDKIATYRVERRQYKADVRKARKAEIRELKKAIQADWKNWCRMCRNILELKRSL